jgi:hypothetical protein
MPTIRLLLLITRDLTACSVGVFLQTGHSPQRPNCLADDAVHYEPVSECKFPGNREINREFC